MLGIKPRRFLLYDQFVLEADPCLGVWHFVASMTIFSFDLICTSEDLGCCSVAECLPGMCRGR